MRRATPACRRRMRARVQNRCRRSFPVWCCGVSSAGSCPGAFLAAASKTESAKVASQGPTWFERLIRRSLHLFWYRRYGTFVLPKRTVGPLHGHHPLETRKPASGGRRSAGRAHFLRLAGSRHALESRLPPGAWGQQWSPMPRPLRPLPKCRWPEARESISGIKRLQARWESTWVQVNLSHCARFVFLSRTGGHAMSRAHHAPETSVAFRPAGSTSGVVLLS